MFIASCISPNKPFFNYISLLPIQKKSSDNDMEMSNPETLRINSLFFPPIKYVGKRRVHFSRIICVFIPYFFSRVYIYILNNKSSPFLWMQCCFYNPEPSITGIRASHHALIHRRIKTSRPTDRLILSCSFPWTNVSWLRGNTVSLNAWLCALIRIHQDGLTDLGAKTYICMEGAHNSLRIFLDDLKL